jgi:diguanylate cyclase (GGDEF)-like protein
MRSAVSILENDGSGARLRSAEKSRRRLAERRQMLVLQAVSYALGDMLLWIYAYAGTIPLAIPSAFFVCGIGVTALFAVLSEIRFSDGFDDHFLTIPQTAANIAMQLGFLLAAPEIGFLFLSVVFVIFGFAALRMTSREAAIALAFTGLGLAVIFSFLQAAISLPMTTAPERFAAVCAFMLTIGQCTYIGLFGNSMRRSLHQRTVELKGAYRRIEELAETDELTGLRNRRSIVKVLHDEIARGERGTACAVALIDVDWFKRINDSLGHPVGDEVLRRVAVTMFANMREGDKIGRYGGEEFLLVLPDTADGRAERLLERLRVIVAELDWSEVAIGMTVTISAGLTIFAPGDSPDSLLGRADRALYAAKAGGRNRIASA